MKKTGQKVIVRNTATQSHNTNYKDASGKVPGDNQILKPKDVMELKGIVPVSDAIKLTCNIHGWMDGYIRAFDHPYATTTKPDGSFEIKGVPTGVPLKIFVWHERAGDLAGKDGQAIEVKDELTKDFKMKVE